MPHALNAMPLITHRHILFFVICRISGPGKALQLWLHRLLRQHLVHFEEGIDQGLFGVAPLVRFRCQQLLSLQDSIKITVQCQALCLTSSLLCSNHVTLQSQAYFAAPS